MNILIIFFDCKTVSQAKSKMKPKFPVPVHHNIFILLQDLGSPRRVTDDDIFDQTPLNHEYVVKVSVITSNTFSLPPKLKFRSHQL